MWVARHFRRVSVTYFEWKSYTHRNSGGGNDREKLSTIDTPAGIELTLLRCPSGSQDYAKIFGQTVISTVKKTKKKANTKENNEN